MLKKITDAAKKHGPGALRRLTETVAPGSGAVLDAADVAMRRVRARKGAIQEEVKVNPFKNKDADQYGAERYPSANHVYHDGEVTAAQQRLVDDGFLRPADVDGCVGPGTLRAIEAWEAAKGKSFYGGGPDDPPAPQLVAEEIIMVSPRVKHTSQGAPEVGGIEIPGLAPDKKTALNRPVKQIGCTSCAMVSVRDFYSESGIDFPDGIRDFIARECYDDKRDLIWGRAVACISEDCGQNFIHRDVSRNAAINYIADDMPVLCFAGRGHWVVGVGYSEDLGIIYNDPATRFGDGYDDPARNSEREGDKGYTFIRFVAIMEA